MRNVAISAAAVQDTRLRRRTLGHMCPQCRSPWALAARRETWGFLVSCRRCSYERPVPVRR